MLIPNLDSKMLRHATTLTVMKIFRPVFKTYSLANIGRTETPEVVRLTWIARRCDCYNFLTEVSAVGLPRVVRNQSVSYVLSEEYEGWLRFVIAVKTVSLN